MKEKPQKMKAIKRWRWVSSLCPGFWDWDQLHHGMGAVGIPKVHPRFQGSGSRWDHGIMEWLGGKDLKAHPIPEEPSTVPGCSKLALDIPGIQRQPQLPWEFRPRESWKTSGMELLQCWMSWSRRKMKIPKFLNFLRNSGRAPCPAQQFLKTPPKL